MKKLIIGLIVGLFLVGCQLEVGQPVVEPEVQVTVESVVLQPTVVIELEAEATRAAVFPATTVVLRRVGPKKAEQWSFNEQGVVVYEGKEQWQDGRFAGLLSFVGADWSSWEKRYEPVGVCADCYEYTITRYQDGRTDQVVVVETAKMPDELVALLDGLKQMINYPPTK